MLSVLVMAGVSAQDAEDGDLSAAIEVVQNTVDLAKPGIYKVTYKVTDRAGAFATKTFTVTVQEKTQEQPTTPVIPNQTSLKIRQSSELEMK